jgi:hypothetical protein
MSAANTTLCATRFVVCASFGRSISTQRSCTRRSGTRFPKHNISSQVALIWGGMSKGSLRRSNQSNREYSGGYLRYQDLPLFPKPYRNRAGSAWREILFRKYTLIQVTRQVLKSIKAVSETSYVAPVQPSSGETTEQGDSLPFLPSIRQALVEIKDFLEQQAVQLREQHGGIQEHLSWEDLMTKIGNCVNKMALEALQERGFAIHAEQLATSNCHGGGFIHEPVDAIDSFVKAMPAVQHRESNNEVFGVSEE